MIIIRRFSGSRIFALLALGALVALGALAVLTVEHIHNDTTKTQ